MIATAWDSARTFRGSDKRGGANGARIRLAPQKDWEGNEPSVWPRCSACWSRLPRDRRLVADVIVLAGNVGLEQAIKAAGHDVPCRSRRAAAMPRTNRPMPTPSMSWSRSPTASATGEGALRRQPRRDDARPGAASGPDRPEMTVLVGGMRVLGTNHGGSSTACSPTGRGS
jgi:catalase-peroxidase